MFEYEKIDFEKSLTSQSAKWIGSDFLSRNMSFLFPLSFIVIILAICTININTIRQYGVPKEIFIVSPIMLLLSILSLRAIIKNNKLVKVCFKLSVVELRRTLKEELEKSGWKVNRSNAKYLTAQKTGFWLSGTKMAILFSDSVAYINVQNIYGNGAYFPFSFGRNKRYTDIISQIIKHNKDASLLK